MAFVDLVVHHTLEKHTLSLKSYVTLNNYWNLPDTQLPHL